MKKILSFFVIICVCLLNQGAVAANFAVKKASPVKKQETSGLDSVSNNSVIPGVLNLVTSVAALKQEQKTLRAECYPTASEQSFVNDMVKEFAKTGIMTAKSMREAVAGNNNKCAGATGYRESVRESKSVGIGKPCVEVFDSKADENKIWRDYPKVSAVTYCPDISMDSCPSKEQYASNIYEIFGLITFEEGDYLASEASKYDSFMKKMEKCSPANIKARTTQAYMNFAKNAVTGIGQKTNTANIWDAVGTLTQGNSTLQQIQTLAPAMVQMFGQ